MQTYASTSVQQRGVPMRTAPTVSVVNVQGPYTASTQPSYVSGTAGGNQYAHLKQPMAAPTTTSTSPAHVAQPPPSKLYPTATTTFGGQPAGIGVPLTPKTAQPVAVATVGGQVDGLVQSGVALSTEPMHYVRATSAPKPGLREQALEQRVRELESIIVQKDQVIKELQLSLSKAYPAEKKVASGKVRSPGRSASSGFRKVSDSKPIIRYSATDQEDPIDVRLEEFYNSTGSAIQFQRINRGFYRFGDSIVELDIINHKLMARTEDGWNRGKFGPIEKFLMYYENIEREKAGIQPEVVHTQGMMSA